MGSVIFKRPPLRKLKKEGLFGVDMHFHTKHSLDAVSRIPAAVKKAQKKGFGFAITDHNTIKGVIASYRHRKHGLIIPGIEVTCRNGNHILAYFYNHKELEEFFDKKLKPCTKKNPFFMDISPLELMQKSQDYNCVICAPHPYAPGAVGLMHTDPPKEFQKKLRMMEVLNGFNFRPANMKAYDYAHKKKKGFTGGSDGHSTFELGKVLTFTECHDLDNIFHDILRRKSVVMGKEDNLFLKAVMSVRKESNYVKRSKENKMAAKLLKSQLGTEYRYIREKFKRRQPYHMLTHQHEEKLKKKSESEHHE